MMTAGFTRPLHRRMDCSLVRSHSPGPSKPRRHRRLIEARKLGPYLPVFSCDQDSHDALTECRGTSPSSAAFASNKRFTLEFRRQAEHPLVPYGLY